MKFITNSDRKFIRFYVIVFFLSVLLLIVGFVVTTVGNIIPEVDFGDPGYDEYEYLMIMLSTSSVLFQNIGIVLFSVATFLGALTDESLSGEIRRALVIASGIGIVALVIFNRLILYFF